MNRNRSLRLALAVGIAAAAALSAAHASNGDVPLYQPTSITQPGRYVLTRDVSAQGDILSILVDGVTVDLNGHTLKSVTGSGVRIDLSGIVMPMDDVRLENGRIAGGGYGINVASAPVDLAIDLDAVQIVAPMFDCIHLPAVSVLHASHLTLQGCGGEGIHAVGSATGLVRLSDSLVTDVQGNGIFLSGVEGAEITRTVVRHYGLGGNATAGIVVTSPGKSGTSIVDSIVSDSGPSPAAGIIIQNAPLLPAVQVVGVEVTGAGGAGIELSDAVASLSKNTIAKNAGDGILEGNASIVGPSMITDNSLIGNTANGFELTTGSVELAHNTIGGNGGDGARVSGLHALIDGNYLEANGGFGLNLLNSGQHAYRGNFVRGNTAGSIQDQFANTDAGGNIN